MHMFKRNGKLICLEGSKSHHFNKRRLKKVDNKYILPSLKATDKIDKILAKKHIKQYGYSGRYTSVVTRHCLMAKYFQSLNNKKNKKQTTKTSKDLDHDVADDDWVQSLKYTLECLIKSPEIKNSKQILAILRDGVKLNFSEIKKSKDDIDQVVNHLKKDPLKVQTKDKKGNPIKFWKFTTGSKHNYSVSTKWFSENHDAKPAWTAKNIDYCTKHNSLQRILDDEHWIPRVRKDDQPLIFAFWGEYGANQNQARKYLKEEYNIYRIDKISEVESMFKAYKNSAVSIVVSPKQVRQLQKKYPNAVIPIKMIMPNQRTVFKHLLRRKVSYNKAKQMIKYNHNLYSSDVDAGLMHGGELIKHTYVILGNQPNRMHLGLDWIMRNKLILPSEQKHSRKGFWLQNALVEY